MKCKECGSYNTVRTADPQGQNGKLKKRHCSAKYAYRSMDN
jgi:hypothetical protein